MTHWANNACVDRHNNLVLASLSNVLLPLVFQVVYRKGTTQFSPETGTVDIESQLYTMENTYDCKPTLIVTHNTNLTSFQNNSPARCHKKYPPLRLGCNTPSMSQYHFVCMPFLWRLSPTARVVDAGVFKGIFSP